MQLNMREALPIYERQLWWRMGVLVLNLLGSVFGATLNYESLTQRESWGFTPPRDLE